MVSRKLQKKKKLDKLDQTAGHPGTFLKKDDKLLKNTIQNEIDFYQSLNNDHRLSPLLPYIPMYYGTTFIDDVHYIKIDNITYGYKEPWILDIKMGNSIYGNKKGCAKLGTIVKAIFSTSMYHNMRIEGIKMGDIHPSRLKHFNIHSVLKSFIQRKSVAKEEWLMQLDDIINLLNTAPCKLYSASLLLTFDALSSSASDCKVRFIDFAHSYIDTPHMHFRKGVLNLMSFLQEIE